MGRRTIAAAALLALAGLLLGALPAGAARRTRRCTVKTRPHARGRAKRCRTVRRIAAPVAGRARTEVAAAPVSPASGSYSFVTGESTSPARWNPCAPVHVVVNLRRAPANGLADLQGALSRLAAETGLQFVMDGTSEVVPTSKTWTNRQAAGGAWAPVLVAWATPAESDLLEGGVAGMGGPVAIAGAAGKVLVSGQVAIDATQSGDYPAGFGTGGTLGALLLHEIGHVVGLGHTSDQRQLMFERVTDKVAELGAGDRAGLAHLGTAAGGCLPAPAP